MNIISSRVAFHYHFGLSKSTLQVYVNISMPMCLIFPLAGLVYYILKYMLVFLSIQFAWKQWILERTPLVTVEN